jgi:hypothetical protein
MTLSTDIQYNSIVCHYAEFRYAECRDYSNFMLCVVMLSVVRLNVIILSVLEWYNKKLPFTNIYPLLTSGFKLNLKQKVSMMIIRLEYDSTDNGFTNIVWLQFY